MPKNSLMEATTGRMLISVCGVMASTSCVVMRSRTTRSIRDRPVRTWFWISSPTVRRRRLPKWSMSSTSTRDVGVLAVPLARHGGLTGVQGHDVLDRRDDVVDREHRGSQRGLDAQLLVDLVAADLGQVVALGVEVEVVQQRLGGLAGRRLARAQLAVDVEQRVVLAGRCGPSPGSGGSTRTRRTPRRICASVQPRAFSSTVTDCLRLRSTRTPTMSRLSISNSSQAPRLGMTLAVKTSLSEVLSAVRSK